MQIDDVRREARRLLSGAEMAAKYQRVFSGPDGEDVMIDLLIAAGMLTVIAAPAHADERAVADGRRAIGIHIMDRMKWSEMALMALASRRNETETRSLVETN